ncbi:MAG: tetratricopeptide repeat protein [Marinilabiliales bacterium]
MGYIKPCVSVILFLLLFYSYSFSQNTLIYNSALSDYKKGLELFNKEKYSSAQKVFDDILKENGNNLSDITTDAQYFSAICAVELFNKDAEYLLSKFIAEHPESPRLQYAKFKMGLYQFRKKKYDDAIKWFEQIDNYNLNNEELCEYYFKTGYCYFMLDKKDKASKAFYEIKDGNNKYAAPANYFYSHIAYENKNYETALQGFQQLSDNEMFGPIVPYYITQIYFYQKKYDKVIEYAPPLLDSASTSRIPEIARVIAEAFYRTEKYNEALPYFELYKEKTINFNRNDIYQIGYTYYKIEDYDNAAKNFIAVVNTRDSLAQNAYYHLADCYLKKNMKEKARMCFSEASKMDFNPTIKEDAMFNYAKLTYELAYSPFNDAIKALQKYIDEYPESDRTDKAYQYLSDVFMTTKNYKGAVEALENIKEITDEIEKAYQKVTFFRGLELFNDGQYGEAIISFDKSLNNAKYNALFKAKALFWKGEAYYNLNRIDEAMKYYNEFILTAGAYGLDIFNAAHYNLGYCYLEKKDYEEAITWFRKYVNRMNDAKTMLVGDAYNRIGDCYFIQSKYDDAKDYYEKSIENGTISVDYALFQKAICHGLLPEKEHNQKIILLTQLINDYPESPYVDDALIEIGKAYEAVDASDMAIVYYEQLINEHPNSQLVKEAILKIGHIYFNKSDYEFAKVNYKKVIEEFPNTSEFKVAMDRLKEIYVEEGKVDDFIANYESKLNISDIEKDSLTYISAEKAYMSGDCDKALPLFESYISKFSTGKFLNNAHFYKAECNYKNGDKDKALESYNYIIQRLQNQFTEYALVRASSINYEKGDYANALSNYMQLEEIAEYKNNKFDAEVGIMRCHFLMKDYEDAKRAAIKVLKSEKISDELFREAHYVIAMCFYNLGQPEMAKDEFTILAQEPKTKEGAQSMYYLAKIQVENKDYEAAKQQIISFNKTGTPHQYWLAKSIILLAIIYDINNETFQAKHTLYSIIDNYDNQTDGIIDEANKLLEEILDSEQEIKQINEANEDVIKLGGEHNVFSEE